MAYQQQNKDTDFYLSKNKFQYKGIEYLGTDKKDLLQLHTTTKAEKADNIINAIELFIKEKGRNFSTSQIRNIYDAILEVDNDNFVKIKLFRPKLAYISARNSDRNAKEIIMLFDILIASTAKHHQLTLITLDNDFKIIAEVLDFKYEIIDPR